MDNAGPARAKRKRKAKGAAIETVRPMVAGIDIGSLEQWVCGPERDDGDRQRRLAALTESARELGLTLVPSLPGG